MNAEIKLQLPNLPRKLNKREADITPRIEAWFQKNYHFDVAIEVKATKTGSIPASAVKPHQLKALLQVQTPEGLAYKIPDALHIRLPFDFFVLKNCHSFVVAVFLSHKVCLAFDPKYWNGAKPTTCPTFSIPLW